MSKQRYDRLAKQKSRGSKRSYVTEIENLQIIIAWGAGEISEGVAAKSIGVDRLALRTMRDEAIKAGQLHSHIDPVGHAKICKDCGTELCGSGMSWCTVCKKIKETK